MRFRVLIFALVLFLFIGNQPLNALATNSTPFTLDVPKNLAVELKYDQNNWPYFAISMDVPESVQAINKNLNNDPGHYSGTTGRKATAAPSSTFTDTTNVEILKAYQLGIVNGIGNNKFSPQVLINREQMAAMLNRAVVAIRPDADTSVTGAPTFSDENEIAPYFISNVKFMAKNGFINWVGNNRFAPKATSTREQAVIVAVRVYETYAGLTE